MCKLQNLLKTPRYATILLVIFYAVGLTGILLEVTRSLFIRLTPLALLISAGMLILHHKGTFRRKDFILLILLYIAGFVLEMIGVNTGLIFGNYSYGSGLGLKIAETPLMIGINWVLLVYCTSAITETTKWKSWITVPLAASILLIYDMILEQVAPSMDMWSWSEGVIPMQNYLAWWIIAFIMHVLVKLFDFRFQNKIALPVLLIQFIFFAVIVILL